MPRLTRHRRAAAAACTTLALVATGATMAVAQVTEPNPTTLKAVGPVSSDHGFPVWYEDSNGLRLEQCLDVTDPYCDPAFLMGEMPDGMQPMSFPENWPMESFYHQVGTVVDAPSGRLGYVAALEATFANEAVQDGDQVVFGRVRFDLDLPGAGTYRVTHPYGLDTFTVSAAEADGFRYVEDLTPAPGNFGLALKSRVNPFLVREGGLITTPNGNKYVGDPAVATRVTGSPLGAEHNAFRVEQVHTDGATTLVGQTDLFNLMGKVSTNSGVNATKAVLNQTAAGTFLDVFAATDSGDTLTVEGTGLETTTLQGDAGNYFARIPLTGTDIPATVKVTNTSDVPVAAKTITVTDEVVISSAVYDTSSDTLMVTAASTDQVDPPALTVEGLSATWSGDTATVAGITAPPASVKVSSAGGGLDAAPVTITGGAAAATPATSAIAVASATQVNPGEVVTLDGTSSQNAVSYAWAQTGGEAVTLTGAASAEASFTAPQTPGDLTFTLTVTDAEGGQATSAPLAVTVLDPNASPPSTDPSAVATATPTNAMVGQTVTVSGADSAHAASYQWTQQPGGTPVSVPTGSQESFSFMMPKTDTPLTFQLTVSNADGTMTSTDSVTVTPIQDELTATAQYRADKREWRIQGTASVTTLNEVSVYLQTQAGAKGALIGEAIVSAPVAPATTGDWSLRVRGSTTAPQAGDTLWVESTRGGSLQRVSIQRR